MHYLKIIDNLLTPEECKFFIDTINKSNMQETQRGELATYYRTKYTNNGFANELFQRVKPYLTELNIPFTGANKEFRLAKYKEGGEFKLHKDGVNQNEIGRSYLTLNIFLNDDFNGGETDFYLDDQSTLRFSARPKSGRAALFYAQQYHCGNIVKNGEKYLLRTDIML